MKKILFLYYRLFDQDGGQVHVGGIETYLQRLIVLTASMGFQPVVVQSARAAFERELNTALVVGLPIKHEPFEKQPRLLYEAALRHSDPNAILVFCTDQCSVRTDRKRAISIQHGIFWDLPTGFPERWPWLAPKLRARRNHFRQLLRALRSFDNCRNRVCVDYNFLNWYRATTGQEVQGNVWVIPNCCSPAPEERINRPNTLPTRVIFARRFTAYRGTRLMADVVSQILRERTDLEFTFAGEGPDLSYLTERFERSPHVQFVRYAPDRSVDIHLEHDIAVIPSLGSEGTSLSVAEAMGAGCAVVASSVGGITNMILDGYNGILAMPTANEFAAAILRLANDVAYRRELAENAYRTAAKCFDVRIWNEKWKRVFEYVASLQP